MPFRRGKGRNKVFKKRPLVINVKALNLLPKDSIVDLKMLIDKKIVDGVDATRYGIKILGDGELSMTLTVKLPTSKQAEEKIKKAGGRVEK